MIANIYRGFPGMVHTGAARAGVENMTMTLAVEWAQFGILVNAVAPGIILSSGTAQYPPQILERGDRARRRSSAPGTVDEVAASIVFLASPAAQFITGATLRIDGGQALWGHTWEIPLMDLGLAGKAVSRQRREPRHRSRDRARARARGWRGSPRSRAARRISRRSPASSRGGRRSPRDDRRRRRDRRGRERRGRRLRRARSAGSTS